MGPSERQPATGRLAQANLEANSEVKVEAKFDFILSGEKWASEPTFASDISRWCECVRVWACVRVCFVLFFGWLVGIVAIPPLPGLLHERAPFF